MLSKTSEVYIYHCATCQLERAVPRHQISPGPVFCGRCHLEGRGKHQLVRDYTAEGLSSTTIDQDISNRLILPEDYSKLKDLNRGR
jgi:hypothetical protein